MFVECNLDKNVKMLEINIMHAWTTKKPPWQSGQWCSKKWVLIVDSTRILIVFFFPLIVGEPDQDVLGDD
jgi:hypothetical protein